MASTFAIDGTVGADFVNPSPTSTHALGTTTVGNDNEVWIYGQASGAVATGTCTVDPVTYLITDAAGNYTADVAIVDNEFAWVRQTAKRTL